MSNPALKGMRNTYTAQNSLTKEAVDTILEFLEVSIHSILYVRAVYPAGLQLKCDFLYSNIGLFERRRKWGVPVRMSRHPDLSTYIRDALLAMRPALERGEAKKVAVEILDSDNVVTEKFIFALDYDMKSFNPIEVEGELSAALQRLCVSDSFLPSRIAKSFQLAIALQGTVC